MDRDTVLWVFQNLRALYAPVRVPPRRAALDTLIQTILSQNTSDTNSDRAFRSLKKAFPTWAEAAAAPVGAVERAIRSGGLAKIKARRIQTILRSIHQNTGRWDLGLLSRQPTETIRQELLRLPGVGPKTVACVLLFSLRRPAMPVDTHVERVSKRLGWASPRTAPDRIGLEYEQVVPPEHMLELHLLLVTHGRRICKARNPQCGRCPLRARCAYGLRVGAPSDAPPTVAGARRRARS